MQPIDEDRQNVAPASSRRGEDRLSPKILSGLAQCLGVAQVICDEIEIREGRWERLSTRQIDDRLELYGDPIDAPR